MKISKPKFFDKMSVFSKQLFTYNGLITFLIIITINVVLFSLKINVFTILIVLSLSILFFLCSGLYIIANEKFSGLITSVGKQNKSNILIFFCFIGIFKTLLVLIPILITCILIYTKTKYCSKWILYISLGQVILFCLLITIVSIINKKNKEK
ncbi:MAG: hypothetical protein Ta2E_07680 [Mycoplasmoidaceae bacterium]|nr:MAG: hypothetical protein Ta2E_07680 [Mycoplasmoidaceae bacterium]